MTKTPRGVWILMLGALLLSTACAPDVYTRAKGSIISPTGRASNDCERQQWLYLAKTQASVKTSRSAGQYGNTAYYNVYTARATGVGIYHHDPSVGFRLSHMELERAFALLDDAQLEHAHYAGYRSIKARHTWGNRLMIWWSAVLGTAGLLGIFGSLPFIEQPWFYDAMGISTGLLLGSTTTMINGLLLKPSGPDENKMWLQENIILRKDKPYINKLIRSVARHNNRVRQQCQ